MTTVKKIHGASLKVQIFLYYIGELENKKSTHFFPEFEQDMDLFIEAGEQKVREGFKESHGLWTWEEYRKSFNWVVTSEASILADDNARKVRDELVAEGFLWKKVYEKSFGKDGTGKKITTYIGLTEKGKKWAPKYIEKYGKAVIEK